MADELRPFLVSRIPTISEAAHKGRAILDILDDLGVSTAAELREVFEDVDTLENHVKPALWVVWISRLRKALDAPDTTTAARPTTAESAKSPDKREPVAAATAAGTDRHSSSRAPDNGGAAQGKKDDVAGAAAPAGSTVVNPRSRDSPSSRAADNEATAQGKRGRTGAAVPMDRSVANPRPEVISTSQEEAVGASPVSKLPVSLVCVILSSYVVLKSMCVSNLGSHNCGLPRSSFLSSFSFLFLSGLEYLGIENRCLRCFNGQ